MYESPLLTGNRPQRRPERANVLSWKLKSRTKPLTFIHRFMSYFISLVPAFNLRTLPDTDELHPRANRVQYIAVTWSTAVGSYKYTVLLIITLWVAVPTFLPEFFRLFTAPSADTKTNFDSPDIAWYKDELI